jgi:NTP pyrophosphatase (non-canonical NTP hydrolase)
MAAQEKMTQYQTMAYRTMKPGSQEDQILHCILGMVGEANEVKTLLLGSRKSEDSLVLELGDCMWYAACLAHALNVKICDLAGRDAERSAGSSLFLGNASLMLHHACTLAEHIKKVRFTGKARDDTLILNVLGWYWGSVEGVCHAAGISPGEVMDRNIAKLEKRYPNLRFDVSDALARADVSPAGESDYTLWGS